MRKKNSDQDSGAAARPAARALSDPEYEWQLSPGLAELLSKTVLPKAWGRLAIIWAGVLGPAYVLALIAPWRPVRITPAEAAFTWAAAMAFMGAALALHSAYDWWMFRRRGAAYCLTGRSVHLRWAGTRAAYPWKAIRGYRVEALAGREGAYRIAVRCRMPYSSFALYGDGEQVERASRVFARRGVRAMPAGRRG